MSKPKNAQKPQADHQQDKAQDTAQVQDQANQASQHQSQGTAVGNASAASALDASKEVEKGTRVSLSSLKALPRTQGCLSSLNSTAQSVSLRF